MSVKENSIINDKRMQPEFKGLTFSKYKMSDVKKALLENINKGNIEQSCYWGAELVCSGHFPELWDCIFHFVGKYIHIGNPKLIIYLEKRYVVFRNIMNQRHYNFELELRNNPTIRSIFAEIITVICLSPKKPSFETIKINKEEEFDMTIIKDRFKAKDTTYANNIFHSEDPKELFIAINEFAYHIGGPKPNMQSACYWIEWVIEFDLLCRKRKQKCSCKRRSVNVETKFQCDTIWLIWDVLIYYSDKVNNSVFITQLMTALRELFSAKYTLGTSKKRKYLLYFAVELLTEHVPTNIDFLVNKSMVKQVLEKIDEIYKQIKKNEESPNTEYLFNNLNTQNNLENSLQKLNFLENMDFVPRK